MYTKKSHVEVVNVANKGSTITQDATVTHNIIRSSKENIYSNVFVSKKHHETNKRKATAVKYRSKTNVSSNNNQCYTSNVGVNYTGYNDFKNLKDYHNSSLNFTTSKQTAKNMNLHKYTLKQYSNNTNGETNSNPISINSVSFQSYIHNEEKSVFFPFYRRQQANTVIYQQHISNIPYLTLNSNQFAQHSKLENWNLNISRFNQPDQREFQNNKNYKILNNNNENINSHHIDHVTTGYIPKVFQNNKQQNSSKYDIELSSINGNNNVFPSSSEYSCSSSSNCQYINRNRVHQNYNNLKYVITNEKSIVENKRSTNQFKTGVSQNPDHKRNQNEELTYENTKYKEKINHTILVNSKQDCDSDSSHSSCPRKTFQNVTDNEKYTTETDLLQNYSLSTCGSETNIPNLNQLTSSANNEFYDLKTNFNGFAVNIQQKNLEQRHSTAGFIFSNQNFFLDTKRLQKRYIYGKRHWISSIKAFNIPEYTPPDRFLTKSYLMELKAIPKDLANGTKWDKLSADIWNKFTVFQQKEETYRKKIFLWKYLYISIKQNFPRYGLYLVGSTITGFGTNSSDIDMCLVHRASFSLDSRFEAISHLNNIKEYLRTLGIFEKFNLIEAKVPILRFCDPNNALEVDLNFNNSVGIRNTHLLYCYSQLDWRLRPLVLISKLWARYHNINNAKTMTISSYSLVLMVIHFLQCGVSPPLLPCLHELYPEKFNIILTSSEFGFVDMIEEIGLYESENTKTLGELFILFLEYYSNFNFSKFAISVRTGKLLLIEECRKAPTLKNDIHQWKELCIEEPFDLTNTARSVYDCETFDKIKTIFLRSWIILRKTLDLNRIFSPLYHKDNV